jgi:phosphoribosyl-ATP pyrophosphohydrolase
MFEKKLRDDILHEIEKVIRSRKEEMPDKSYISHLLKGGQDLFLRKIGEEATELILAAKNEDRFNIIFEASDLLFHILVLLGHYGIPIEDIYTELKRRYKHPVKSDAGF